jgi:ArsR family transcriptional regulator, arsenate/arsenite/antimonite-responsive transcriptional repressor
MKPRVKQTRAVEHERLAKMCKALGHPNRLRLFIEIVEAGERSFEEGHRCLLHTVMERLDVGAPTVSHHLKELVNAGLVDTDREGKFVTCRVNDDAMGTLARFFGRS